MRQAKARESASDRAAGRERVRQEGPMPLDEAAVLFGAKSLSISTVIRWIVAGKGGVRLEATRVRGQYQTSRQAIERFVAGCNQAGRPLFGHNA